MEQIKNTTLIRATIAYIRNTLEDEVIPAMNKGRTTGGFVSVPLLIFSCIELLGVLWKNPQNIYYDTIKHGVAYLKFYMGKVNIRYKRLAGILYFILRHPLTHKFQQDEILLNCDRVLGWALVKNGRKISHLNIQANRIVVDLNQFYNDLLASIDLFEQDLIRSKNLKIKFRRALIKVEQKRLESDIRRKKYIKKEDFNYILKELKMCVC